MCLLANHARKYGTFIFDCDGVVLNSNRVKTHAFRLAALPWGTGAAEELVTHHVANGGISRYAKFAHFITYILPRHAPGCVPGRDGPDMNALLAAYAHAVRSGLESCQIAEGLQALRVATPQARWLIVSGGDQAELRKIFSRRKLADLFDGGIFGSPDSKFKILEREINQRNIKPPALFLGDSRLDHEAASANGLDFVFVSGWTEFDDWEAYSLQHSLETIDSISCLISVRREDDISDSSSMTDSSHCRS